MALDQDMDRLSKIPIFSVLDSGALRLLAFSGDSRNLRVGDVLFREGDPGDGGYFVRSGCLILTKSTAGPSRTAATAPAGVLVGETALLRTSQRPATATAREPSSLLRISRFLFHRVLLEHQGSAERVRAFLAARLHEQLQGLRAEGERITS
jgi:CRP-like cAMP-binding protein